jgi:hypothetical protein
MSHETKCQVKDCRPLRNPKINSNQLRSDFGRACHANVDSLYAFENCCSLSGGEICIAD